MRLLYLTITCGLLLGTLTSCSKELALSCDPEINGWAKREIAKFEAGPREMITALPINKARAIYRGLSNEYKMNLWMAKIDSYVKSAQLLGEERTDYELLCAGLLKCEKKTPEGCQEVADCGIVGTSNCTGICL